MPHRRVRVRNQFLRYSPYFVTAYHGLNAGIRTANTLRDSPLFQRTRNWVQNYQQTSLRNYYGDTLDQSRRLQDKGKQKQVISSSPLGMTINSSTEGHKTYSRVYHHGPKPSKRQRAFKFIGAAVSTTAQRGGNFYTGEAPAGTFKLGRQEFGNWYLGADVGTTFDQDMTMLYNLWKTQQGAIPLNVGETDGLYVERMTQRLEMKNASTVACNLVLYDTVCRRDETETLADYSLLWESGMQDAATSIPAIGAAHVVGVRPSMSKDFKMQWKIVKTTKIHLLPGATHVHIISSKPNLFLDSPTLALPGTEVYQGVTANTVAVFYGDIVHSVDHTTTTYGPARIEWVQQKWYKCRGALGQSKLHKDVYLSLGTTLLTSDTKETVTDVPGNEITVAG